MWPRSTLGEARQRQLKRDREGAVLHRLLAGEIEAAGKRSPSIMEFGVGAGYHTPWLATLGRLVACDVYIDPALRLPEGVRFTLCDIARTCFPGDHFDLVFSNHVIEHLTDYPACFRELRRIGAPDCIYAFAVPTSLWTILSIPVQYRDKFVNILRRLFPAAQKSHAGDNPTFSERVDHASYGRGFWSKLLPHGHGAHSRISSAFLNFRASAWRHLFEVGGFRVVKEHRVLCYAPPGWPVIPPNTLLTRVGLCSSRLFILKKKMHCQAGTSRDD